MLPKKNRVSRHLFPIIITKGKNHSSSNIYMRVVSLPLLPYPRDQVKQIFYEENKDLTRFSFVVSKKAVKKAVTRNKIRRVGYNIIQKNIFYIKKGFLVAVFIKKNAAEISNKELEEEIVFLLKKANLLKTK